jgi:CRISPR-associated protein Csm2
MNQKPNKPKSKNTDTDIKTKILSTLKENDDKELGLQHYHIRQLIKDTEAFGNYLKTEGLKTNQIRKFLDSVNRIKTEIAVKTRDMESESGVISLEQIPKIETQVVLLKQKIDYAAAKQKAVKPLQEVMDIAIDQVHDVEDFERLFQLVESIIAYHKAAGGE